MGNHGSNQEKILPVGVRYKCQKMKYLNQVDVESSLLG